MHKYLPTALIILLFSVSAFAQFKSHDQMEKQIKKLNTGKNISVSYDGNTSKVMAVAENFGNRDVSRVGAQAMNFAMGFFYAGDTLKESPDPILLSFWVLTKKPHFADIHSVTFLIGSETLVYDNIRYAAKAREDMEYINCKINRADLSKMTSGQDVRVRLGDAEFKLSVEQIHLMSDVLNISDAGSGF
ncbi:MAG: hypothetical protein ABI999_07000 [Acidobacteriota bacterium]